MQALAMMPRTYQLEDLGLELFLQPGGRESLYLTFQSPPARDAAMKLLAAQPALRLAARQSRRRWREDWRAGRVSNFEYLVFLNREAGRSFQVLLLGASRNKVWNVMSVSRCPVSTDPL